MSGKSQALTIMFIPSIWAIEVRELKSSRHKQAIAIYITRFALGLTIPKWMVASDSD